MVSNETIVVISMVLSWIIVFGFKRLNTIIDKNKCDMVYERFVYLKKLEKNGKIEKEVFSFEDEEQENINFQKTSKLRKTEVILYGKKYTDKTSWFIIEDNVLWIAGKKEDFLIQVYGNFFEEIGG